MPMEIKAVVRSLPITPRKIRLVADIIRRKSVDEAEKTLMLLDNRAALPLRKLLQSAAANAFNSAKLSKEELVIQSIEVSEGIRMKRARFASRGRTHPYKKRTTHVAIYLIKR